MATTNIPFGLLVRQVRNSKGILQKDLAKTLGKESYFISDLETTRKKPDLPTVKAFAKALDVPVSEIMPAELGKWSLNSSKKSSANSNVKLLLQCCFLAIGIVALIGFAVNKADWVQAAVENPQKRAQFEKAVLEYPEDGRKRMKKAYQCFTEDLSDTEREDFWRYAKNYSHELLRERAMKFKGQSSLYLKTFVCDEEWADFVNE